MILSCHINKNILKLKKKKHLSFEPLETHIVQFITKNEALGGYFQ